MTAPAPCEICGELAEHDHEHAPDCDYFDHLLEQTDVDRFRHDPECRCNWVEAEAERAYERRMETSGYEERDRMAAAKRLK